MSKKGKKSSSGQSQSRKPAPFHSVRNAPLKKIHEGAEGSTSSAPTAAAETTATAQQQRVEESTPEAHEHKQQCSPSAPDPDSWKEVARPPTPPRAPKQKASFGSGQPPSPFVGDIPGASGVLDALSRVSGRGGPGHQLQQRSLVPITLIIIIVTHRLASLHSGADQQFRAHLTPSNCSSTPTTTTTKN